MKCCVKGCKSQTGGKYPGISFFIFPKCPQRQAQWLKSIGGNEAHLRRKICSLHFEDEDIMLCASRKFLRSCALPKLVSKKKMATKEAEPVAETGMDHTNSSETTTAKKDTAHSLSKLPDINSGSVVLSIEEAANMLCKTLEENEDTLLASESSTMVSAPTMQDEKPVIGNLDIKLKPSFPSRNPDDSVPGTMLDVKEERVQDEEQPHRKLSFETKVEIIKEYERTKKRTHLAKLFGCHVGQINRTLQHKIEIIREFQRMQETMQILKKRPPCRMLQAVGTVLNEFVLRCSHYPYELTDDILLDKAQEIAKQLNLLSFRKQNYWLKTFKMRFKLTNIDWKSWNVPCAEKQRSLDIETIIEQVRARDGPHVIPYPDSMSHSEYEKAVQELLANSPGYPDSADSHGSHYADTKEIVILSDSEATLHDDLNPSYPSDSDGEYSGMTDDPMKIDCYQTALSYFRPLEQFILTKKNNLVLPVVNQLGRLLLKAADTQEEADNQMTDEDHKVPFIVNEVTIDGYDDALRYLRPLDEFFLDNENMRAVGLINQLEVLLRNE